MVDEVAIDVYYVEVVEIICKKLGTNFVEAIEVHIATHDPFQITISHQF